MTNVDFPRLDHGSLSGYFEQVEVWGPETPEVWTVAGGEILGLWTEVRQMKDEVSDFIHHVLFSAIPR